MEGDRRLWKIQRWKMFFWISFLVHPFLFISSLWLRSRPLPHRSQNLFRPRAYGQISIAGSIYRSLTLPQGACLRIFWHENGSAAQRTVDLRISYWPNGIQRPCHATGFARVYTFWKRISGPAGAAAVAESIPAQASLKISVFSLQFNSKRK